MPMVPVTRAEGGSNRPVLRAAKFFDHRIGAAGGHVGSV